MSITNNNVSNNPPGSPVPQLALGALNRRNSTEKVDQSGRKSIRRSNDATSQGDRLSQNMVIAIPSDEEIDMCIQTGAYEPAAKALAVKIQHLPQSRYSLHPDLKKLEDVLARLDPVEETIEILERILEVQESKTGKESLQYAEGCNALSAILIEQKRFQRAGTLLDHALSILTDEEKDDDELEASVSYSLFAKLKLAEGKQDEALACLEYERSLLEEVEENISQKFASLSKSWHLSALIYLSKKLYPQAIEYFEKSLNVSGRRENQIDQTDLESCTYLIQIHSMLGNTEKASQYREVAQKFQRVIGHFKLGRNAPQKEEFE